MMIPFDTLLSDKKTRLATAAVFLAVLLLGAGWLVTQNLKGFVYPAPHLMTFLNLSPNASLSATLENGRSVTPLVLDGDTIKLPDDQKRLNRSYVIRLTLKEGDVTRDIALKVVKGDEGVRVIADGYDPENLMTLSIDNVSFFQDVPFDWSGKLELPSVVTADQNVNVCVTIKTQAPPFGFCHVVAARKKA
jgi:hypothetical protein